MALKNFKNLAEARVSGTYDADDIAITLRSGDVSRMPAVPFVAWWFNSTLYPLPINDPNYEIVLVTAINGDVLTVTRGQEGIAASTKNGNGTYALVHGFTAGTITDIAAEIASQVASGGSGDTFIKVYRTTDSGAVNNSTVLVADDTLEFAVGANEVWAFTLIAYWSSATAGLKWAFSGPASATFKAGTDSGSFGVDATCVDALDAEMSTWHASNPGCVPIHGFITNGATPGTVTFKFAQKSGVSEDTKILAGSHLIAHKVSA